MDSILSFSPDFYFSKSKKDKLNTVFYILCTNNSFRNNAL